jgi:hypothetical protein
MNDSRSFADFIAPAIRAALGDSAHALFSGADGKGIHLRHDGQDWPLLTDDQIYHERHAPTNYLRVKLGMIAAGIRPDEIRARLIYEPEFNTYRDRAMVISGVST